MSSSDPTTEGEAMNRFRMLPLAALCVCVQLVGVLSAQAQSAENVAIVVNDASPASQQIAEAYIRKRGVPPSNVIHVTATTDDQIERAAYAATLEGPIAAALSKGGLQDRVLYIVLTKGVPLRINGTAGLTGTVASVDSELTLLYRRMAGVNVPIVGRIDNPYFLGSKDLKEAHPFSHRLADLYLVARLDGFTVADVLALIEKGSAPGTDGQVVLDQQDKLVDRIGDTWLEQASARLASAGLADRVVIEKTVQPARDIPSVLGYYSWGSNDPRNRVRRFGMGFAPGALAATYVSTDARTFAEPPADWVPSGDWDNRRSFFGGSPQTLVGDLIREGATGVAGQVAEPYLQSTIRPDILFPAYFAGLNLIESFYLAMPHLSWQTVVVGDPLAAPFRKATVAKADLDPGVDAITQLPAFFSARRLEQLKAESPGTPEAALAQRALHEVHLSRGDTAMAVAALEKATALAPGYATAHLQLAGLLERGGQLESAATRYRRVLELQPRNVAAMNNLAYLLAARLRRPAEGLPLAQQVQRLAPQNPLVLDTLGWIQYLSGDSVAAAKTLAVAAKGAPGSAEVRLHTAVAMEATGARAAAEFELAEALRLDPSLGMSEEVASLRRRLAATGTAR